MRKCVGLWAIILAAVLTFGSLGCQGIDKNADRTEVDYTVVESGQWPEELKKLINEKKSNTMKITYTTRDYTYVVAGYGTMETGGYSVVVEDVYLADNALVVDFNLMGPSANETVTMNPTTPLIVIKMEKRDESILFNM